MDLGLQGKKAIIVGAARGIGMATAEVLAREGCDLAITARSEDGVKDAVANLGKYGTKVIGKAVELLSQKFAYTLPGQHTRIERIAARVEWILGYESIKK